MKEPDIIITARSRGASVGYLCSRYRVDSQAFERLTDSDVIQWARDLSACVISRTQHKLERHQYNALINMA